MKYFFTLLLAVALNVTSALAQTIPTCKPAATLPDTVAGVFPLPYEPTTNPKGGISDTACLNTYYEYVLSVVVPPVFTAPGIGSLPLNRISMPTTNAIQNLPTGISYACNPPNCVFERNTKGCVILYGTPSNVANIGANNLIITGTVSSILDIPVTFPSTALGLPGNYFLYLRPSGSPACKTLSTNELLATRLKMTNFPNPYTGITQIEIESELRGAFDLRVYDFTGKIIHRQPVDLQRGINRFSFDGSQLAAGIYIYTLTDGLHAVSRKMVVE